MKYIILVLMLALVGCSQYWISANQIKEAQNLCVVNGGIDFVRVSHRNKDAIYVVCKNKARFEYIKVE